MFNSNFLSKMTKKSFNLRKVFAIAICLAAMTMFSGCKDKNSGENNECGSTTLTGLKNAAKDMGIFSTEEAYPDMWDAIDGFTIVYDLPGKTTRHNVVLQFKDRAAADACAKKEKDSGTKIPIQNCKFLTFASATEGVLSYEEEKTLLENLMK